MSKMPVIERKQKSKLQKLLKISPTFCVYPWMEFILGPTKHIKLCCISDGTVKDEKGKAYTFDKDHLEGYWNSYGLRQIRKKMLLGGRIKGCDHCYYQESIGLTSYRQSFNKEWLLRSEKGQAIADRVEKSRWNGYRVEEPPLYLDIRPGNLCNLKCRMCNPGNSSKLYQEHKEMLKNNPSELSSLISTDYFKTDEKQFHNWHKDKRIWDSLYKWAGGVKKLYFTGGEPTLIKENWSLIDHLKKKGLSKNIHLTFNINCTQAPQKLLDTFSSFAKVTVIFSVDGYKEAQEYIRHPSKWQDIESNIITILKCRKENTEFYFSPVVQAYNIFNLPKFLNWASHLQNSYGTINQAIIILTEPDFLDIAHLPKLIRKEALVGIENYELNYKGGDSFLLECLRAIKNILNQEEKPYIDKYLKKFYKYTKLLDQQRGNHFEQTFPELNERLNKDGRWKG